MCTREEVRAEIQEACKLWSERLDKAINDRKKTTDELANKDRQLEEALTKNVELILKNQELSKQAIDGLHGKMEEIYPKVSGELKEKEAIDYVAGRWAERFKTASFWATLILKIVIAGLIIAGFIDGIKQYLNS